MYYINGEDDERDYAEEAANAELLRETDDDFDCDPIQALSRIRASIASIRALHSLPVDDYIVQVLPQVATLIDNFEQLDRWMSHNGQPPRDWMTDEEWVHGQNAAARQRSIDSA